MTSPTARDDSTEIATLRIELIDSDPLIWRELEIPTSITLKGLHDIVQASMNWEDYHLWQFVVDRQTYGLPREDAWEPPRKIASRVRLCDVLSAKSKTKITYTYDFGGRLGASADRQQGTSRPAQHRLPAVRRRRTQCAA